MLDKNIKTGDSVTYGQNTYKVIENRITKGKKKQKSFVSINILSILMIGITLLFCFTIIKIIGVRVKITDNYLVSLIYLAASIISFIIFAVLHEYVHYLTYRFLGKIPKNKVKFGVVLKMGMAYCISLEPNTIKTSRLSLMMPFYVLVIPVIIISIILQNNYLAFLAAIFASGSGGDIWYMWTLRKDSPDKYMVEAMPSDDGYEIGYLLLDKVN